MSDGTNAAADQQPVSTLHSWVPRRVRSQKADGSWEIRRLCDWRSAPAYVLLGDPGAGKSICFQQEAEALSAYYLHASDVVDEVIQPSDFRGGWVFIDGLDQIKASGAERSALGAIRKWLAQAHVAGFRVSCREADWLGEVERETLERVAPDHQLTVLRLEPLSQAESLHLLAQRSERIGDPRAFWDEAERRNLTAWLGSPLLLDLLTRARHEREWPPTLTAVYEEACAQIVQEHSLEHQALAPAMPGRVDHLLDSSGLLCAVLLLSGKQGIGLQRPYPSAALDLDALPPELDFGDARQALATKLFTAPTGQAEPLHRTIAEFLAARAIAKRLNQGLPLPRALAFILGIDGAPVEALRGLLAWLIVHHEPSRPELLAIDPLGFVVNGDPARLPPQERIELLRALAAQAQRNPWFRNQSWASHPFGPLATDALIEPLKALLVQPQRDRGHQAFMDCVFDALLHGDHMPALAPLLAAWVCDETALGALRQSAYQAWLLHVPAQDKLAQEKAWLDRLAAESLCDEDGELLGTILSHAYPHRIGPHDLLRYLHPLASGRVLGGRAWMFWHERLVEQATPEGVAILADQWPTWMGKFGEAADSQEVQSCAHRLLARALNLWGDAVSEERLYGWLAIGLDQYGFSDRAQGSALDAGTWLRDRPFRVKNLLWMGLCATVPDDQGRWPFWQADQRVLGVRPRAYFRWHLEFAAAATSPSLAQHCFQQAAWVAINPEEGFEALSMEEVERWTAHHDSEERPYEEWLEQAWTSPLDSWQARQHESRLKHRANASAARDARRQYFAPHVESLSTKYPPAWLMNKVVMAAEKRFTDLHGETPLERVEDLLLAGSQAAQRALEAVRRTLSREDLPTPKEILALDAGHEHHIRPVALWAATDGFNADASILKDWSPHLIETLVAFYLCDGTGSMPRWYRVLIASRPQLVAGTFIDYVSARLNSGLPVNGVCPLAREDDHRAFVPWVLPTLLERFPARAFSQARRELDASLLAALPRLPAGDARDLLGRRLARSDLDRRQRVSLLVADLRYRTEALEELGACISTSRPRLMHASVAIHEQNVLAEPSLATHPSTLRRLIEWLAPVTSTVREQVGWVGPNEQRESLIRTMLHQLAQDESNDARIALKALAQSSSLGDWQATAEYFLHSQRAVIREARFQLADPSAVIRALANGRPAHHADMKALVLGHLAAVDRELRGANTSAWRWFWSDDGTPREENACRDLILERLKPRLAALGIVTGRETSESNDTRADLSASFVQPGGRCISLPIEAKKDSHKDLWVAWQDQLQAKYTINPDADGHGIYLVFWFNPMTQPLPEAPAPADALGLKALLEAQMPEEARRQIAVFVLDLSKPDAAPTRRARPRKSR